MKTLSTMLFVCAIASAEEFHQVEGVVVSNSGNLEGASWAKLTSVPVGVAVSGPVTPEGRFTFLAVPVGAYKLQIMDAAGLEIIAKPVVVQGTDVQVTVALGDAVLPEARAAGSKVSVAALQHTPPKAARREAEQAQKLAARGDHAGATDKFRKAIEIDPRYVQARGDLGAQYILLHKYAEAAQELRQAIAFDPSAGWLQADLAFALLRLGEAGEAEQWARRAVAADSRNAKSRSVLGWILVHRAGGSAEGVQQLEQAARDLPGAHRMLADYYRAMGDTAMARREMERYLGADPAANRAEAEGWIESLR
jgi:tetratricopeptide (TPR) repeat protein